MQYSLSRK